MQRVARRKLLLAIVLGAAVAGSTAIPTTPLDAAAGQTETKVEVEDETPAPSDDEADAAPTADAVQAERTVRRITGYPKCGSDEEPHGWVWFEGDARLGSSPDRVWEYEGEIYTAHHNSCVGAAACLAGAPELSGKLPTIIGSERGDDLVGTPWADLIIAGAGADSVTGRGGADVICGGDGIDHILGGPGNDRIWAGEGDDVVRGNGNDDVLFGEAGVDVVIGGPGDDALDGGDDDDGLYGEGGADDLDGGGGENGCFGGKGTDQLAGCRVAQQGSTWYGSPPLTPFDIEIEAVTGVDYDQFAAEIDRTLGDTRSWIGNGRAGFRRVRSGGTLRIILATPATVDRLCAPLNTAGYYSCRRGNKLILNVNRWNGATSWWPASLKTYRRYLINHEMGHFLGYGHVSCPGPGRLAPVMMQQTISLGGCVANGWPYP